MSVAISWETAVYFYFTITNCYMIWLPVWILLHSKHSYCDCFRASAPVNTATVSSSSCVIRSSARAARSPTTVPSTRSTWLPLQSSPSLPSSETNGSNPRTFPSATPASPPASDRKWALMAETLVASSGCTSLRRLAVPVVLLMPNEYTDLNNYHLILFVQYRIDWVQTSVLFLL